MAFYKTIAYRDKFTTLKEATATAMNDVFKKRGFENNKIITEWNNIVGEELSGKYKPSKITHNGKSVVLFVDSITLKDRQHITYNKSIIIEKINQFCGHQAIDNIKIID